MNPATKEERLAQMRRVQKLLQDEMLESVRLDRIEYYRKIYNDLADNHDDDKYTAILPETP